MSPNTLSIITIALLFAFIRTDTAVPVEANPQDLHRLGTFNRPVYSPYQVPDYGRTPIMPVQFPSQMAPRGRQNPVPPPTYQPQPQYQPQQPQYQPQQPQYQPQYQPQQPQYRPQPAQPQYRPQPAQPQYQPAQPQYQPVQQAQPQYQPVQQAQPQYQPVQQAQPAPAPAPAPLPVAVPRYAAATAVVPEAKAKAGDKYINGQTYQGDCTYYSEWSTFWGSCGKDYNKIDEFLVAMSFKWMALTDAPGGASVNHPLCADNYCIQVEGPNGALVAKITDSCAGCKPNDVDLSDTIYQYVADVDKGRVQVKWHFVDCKENKPGVIWSSSKIMSNPELRHRLPKLPDGFLPIKNN